MQNESIKTIILEYIGNEKVDELMKRIEGKVKAEFGQSVKLFQPYLRMLYSKIGITLNGDSENTEINHSWEVEVEIIPN